MNLFMYTNDFIGNVEILAQGSRLVMEMGPNKMQPPLTHYDHDMFYY